MAIIRFKNNTGSSDTWVGQTISAAAYYEPDLSELTDWRTDTKVFQDVGTGDLLVNKGADTVDDIADPVAGWNWALGNPPEEFFLQAPDISFVGSLRTKRLKVFKYSQKFILPSDISNLTIKNVGTKNVCISFNNDDNDDYFILESKESTKIERLTASKRLLKYVAVDNKSELELIMWG